MRCPIGAVECTTSLDCCISAAFTRSYRCISEAPDAVFSLPVEGQVFELDDTFRAAAHAHLVGSISDIRAEALREVDSYRGLGSLPQHDALVFRNTPVIEMAGGALVPLSIELSLTGHWHCTACCSALRVRTQRPSAICSRPTCLTSSLASRVAT